MKPHRDDLSPTSQSRGGWNCGCVLQKPRLLV